MTPTHIILHHSLTKDSNTVSWSAIRKYHIVDQGWRDIGYHFGIELIGEYYEILLGRLPDEMGAHCVAQGMNHGSLGICVVGNFDLARPCNAQWQRTLNLVRWLCQEHSISVDRVLGHGEVSKNGRTCPGRFFDMGKFRTLL